jgi:hypothetical protein
MRATSSALSYCIRRAISRQTENKALTVEQLCLNKVVIPLPCNFFPVNFQLAI